MSERSIMIGHAVDAQTSSPRRTSILIDNGRLSGFKYATALAAFSLVACFTFGRIYDRQLNAVSGLVVLMSLLGLAFGYAWYMRSARTDNYASSRRLKGFMQATGASLAVTVVMLASVQSYHGRSDWTISATEVLLLVTALSFANACVQAFRRG